MSDSESEEIIFISNPDCPHCKQFQKDILISCGKTPTEEIIENPVFTLKFSDKEIQLKILYALNTKNLDSHRNENQIDPTVFDGTPFVCYIKKRNGQVIENYHIKEYRLILNKENKLDSIIKGATRIFPMSVGQNTKLSSKKKYLKYKLKYLSMK